MDTTLGATAPRPQSFRNIKDTIALNVFGRVEPPDNGASSESSSYRELNDTEQKALKRSFRAIQTPPDPIEQDDGMAFQDTWQPSHDIQMEMAGVSSPAKTKSWDLDIQTTAVSPGGDKIQLIPTQTRDVTPDSTGFSNKLTMNDQRGPGQGAKNINAANIQQGILGKSTRELLEQMNEQDVSEEPIASQDRKNDNDSTVDMISNTDERIFPCWPRMLLFLLVVLALAGGIIAVVIIFREGEPEGEHGSIIPNPITDDECRNNPLSLGDTLEITCQFNLGHKHREQLKDAINITVESPNQLPASSFQFVKVSDDTWYIQGPQVTCTSRGTYLLRFVDINDDVLHIASVSLALKSGTIVTSIRQRKLDEYGDTMFDVTCSIGGDCNNYDVDFLGRRVSYSDMLTLNENKKCSTVFNDTAGYTTNCTAELEDEVIDMFRSFVGCRMTSGATIISSQILLPECNLTPECNFNCSSKASERISLDIGHCDRQKITRCFPSTRPVWRYKLCPALPNDCDKYEEQYECRLGWCRSRTGVYYKNELVGGDYLCADFEAKVPRTSTTTTTTSTTTTTTTTTTASPTTTLP